MQKNAASQRESVVKVAKMLDTMNMIPRINQIFIALLKYLSISLQLALNNSSDVIYGDENFIQFQKRLLPRIS